MVVTLAKTAVVARPHLEASISTAYQPRITQLGPEHEAEFRNLLLDLDRPSRFSRFAGTVSDAGLVRHSRLALSTATWVAGAFLEENLRGVVELYGDSRSRDVEAAFVVAEGSRRRGLGTALLGAAIRWARQSQRSRLRMIFSRCNWPMRKLASTANARLDLLLDETVADIEISPACSEDTNRVGQQSLS